ncbi:MAG: hypothetical protein KDA21_11305, partial [Phycisphaerales bacterium]|nr:hypothetical protein [Phycisphaerales bacterium]
MASTLGRLFSWLSGSVPGDNTPPEMRADSVEVVAPAPMPQVPQGSQSVLHADVTESWLGSNPGPAALTSTPSWLNAQQTRAVLVNSGLMHRIVWVIPEDALSDGWKTEDESAEDEGEEREDITSNLDTRLQLQDRLKLAAGTARATGGAWLWVVLRNDRDFRAPLPPGPHEIAAV